MDARGTKTGRWVSSQFPLLVLAAWLASGCHVHLHIHYKDQHYAADPADLDAVAAGQGDAAVTGPDGQPIIWMNEE
jgi:hypothetical protein